MVRAPRLRSWDRDYWTEQNISIERKIAQKYAAEFGNRRLVASILCRVSFFPQKNVIPLLRSFIADEDVTLQRLWKKGFTSRLTCASCTRRSRERDRDAANTGSLCRCISEWSRTGLLVRVRYLLAHIAACTIRCFTTTSTPTLVHVGARRVEWRKVKESPRVSRRVFFSRTRETWPALTYLVLFLYRVHIKSVNIYVYSKPQRVVT